MSRHRMGIRTQLGKPAALVGRRWSDHRGLTGPRGLDEDAPTPARFFRTLGRNEAFPASRAAVVVAHPDDEAVGIGGQLDRLPGVCLVHMTDGAPRDMTDALNRGFQSQADYATARRQELEAAVALAGVPRTALLRLGLVDQEAALHLVEATEALARLFAERELEIVLTHPYEGGHPDHDATAFAVHAACRLLRREGRRAPALIEMASYFLGPEGYCLHQRFASDRRLPELAVSLDGRRRALKRGMLAAHASQAGSLWIFTDAEERFRPAPRYDFTAPPNGGRIHYDRFGWGMTAERWAELAAEALTKIG